MRPLIPLLILTPFLSGPSMSFNLLTGLFNGRVSRFNQYRHQLVDSSGSPSSDLVFNSLDYVNGPIKAMHFGPWTAPNGSIYAVVGDGGDYGIRIAKSSDGVTWSSLGYPGPDYVMPSDIAMRGSVLYVFYLPDNKWFPKDYKIIRFDTTTDSFLSNLVVPVVSLTPSSGSQDFGGIAVRTNGDIIVTYVGSQETIGGYAYDRVWSIIYDAASSTWGSPAQVPGQAGIANIMFPMCIELVPDSDRAHIFLIGDYNYPFTLYHITLDATGVFHTFQTVANDGDSADLDPFASYLSAAWKSGSTSYIGYPYTALYSVTGSSHKDIRLLMAPDADDPVWANNLVAANTSASNKQPLLYYGWPNTAISEVVMSLAAQDSTVDLYWVHSDGPSLPGGVWTTTNEKVYHSKSTDNGSTWSAIDILKAYEPTQQLFSVCAPVLWTAPPPLVTPLYYVEGSIPINIGAYVY